MHAASRAPRRQARLYAFSGANKPGWSLPEFDDDVQTLVLTASNGVGLAQSFRMAQAGDGEEPNS